MESRKSLGIVLVVDDEAMIKDLARDILVRHGYSVLTAGSGEEALVLYQRHVDEISVVLLDILMPVMDGKEVFRLIRGINASARVIVSSGYSNDAEAEYLVKLGAAGFVQKPYRMADLVKAVGAVVAKT